MGILGNSIILSKESESNQAPYRHIIEDWRNKLIYEQHGFWYPLRSHSDESQIIDMSIVNKKWRKTFIIGSVLICIPEIPK